MEFTEADFETELINLNPSMEVTVTINIENRKNLKIIGKSFLDTLQNTFQAWANYPCLGTRSSQEKDFTWVKK